MTIYKSTLRKRFKNQSEKQISEKAVEELKVFLENIEDEVIEESNSLADHAERRTIKKKDVKKAIEHRTQE